MASGSITSSYTSVTGTISGLQYNANTYMQIVFELYEYQWNGSSWEWKWIDMRTYPQSSLPASTSVSCTFTYLKPSTYYCIDISVQHSSGWYYFATPYISTLTIPPATVQLNSATTNSLTIYRSNIVGNLETFMWWNGAWTTLANTGLNLVVNSANKTVTINGLLPDSDYYFFVRTWVDTYYTDAPNDGTGWYTYRTAKAPIPATPDAPSVTRSDDAFYFYWNAVANASSYTLRLYNSDRSWSQTFDTSTNNITLTNAGYGNTYYASVKANNSSGSSPYSAENTATSLPKIPTISTSNIKSTSIDVSITGMQGNYTSVIIEWRVNGSGSGWSSWTVGNSTTSMTITGLNFGTTYEIRARSKYTINGVDLYSNYSSSITATTQNRPNNFSWTTSISQGGVTHSMDLPNKRIYIMTATEWNNFTSRINEFRGYKGLTAYSFTSVSRGTAFTYTIYNQARNALYDLRASFSGTYANGNNFPATVSTGTKISANHFIALKDAMNSIP